MSSSANLGSPALSSTLYNIFLKPTPMILALWVRELACFNAAIQLYSNVTFSIIQDLDAGGIGKGSMAWHVLCSYILMTFYMPFENVIKLYSILFPPQGFHVVAKA